MTKLYLAVLLALGAAPVQAQPSLVPVPIQPSPDSAEDRKVLRALTACLAKARPGWARQTLSHPYLSDAQARAASLALSGKDKCIKGQDVEVTFRTSGLVGSLAEHYLKTDVQRVDGDRLTEQLSSMTPLNNSEDFAICVAVRNTAAARELALSEPGSAMENEAARKLAGELRPCIYQGQQLTVDLQSLRALVSTALYRGVTTALAARTD